MKYLKEKDFNEFLKNDWKHLRWKVNGLIAGAALIVAMICGLYAVLLSVFLGG